MAEALSKNISQLVHGKSQMPDNDPASTKPNAAPSASKGTRVLIEEIDEINDEYTSCMRDVNDPLVPVRAHGLVTLRKLIEKRNPQVTYLFIYMA